MGSLPIFIRFAPSFEHRPRLYVNLTNQKCFVCASFDMLLLHFSLNRKIFVSMYMHSSLKISLLTSWWSVWAFSLVSRGPRIYESTSEEYQARKNIQISINLHLSIYWPLFTPFILLIPSFLEGKSTKYKRRYSCWWCVLPFYMEWTGNDIEGFWRACQYDRKRSLSSIYQSVSSPSSSAFATKQNPNWSESCWWWLGRWSVHRSRWEEHWRVSKLRWPSMKLLEKLSWSCLALIVTLLSTKLVEERP